MGFMMKKETIECSLNKEKVLHQVIHLNLQLNQLKDGGYIAVKKDTQIKKKLLIEADAGVRSGYRPHQLQVKLQEILCNKHGLIVPVSHYPPGASKWNLIEHRLSEITKNWQAAPLIDYETVLKLTLSTKTTTGLFVNAVLVDKKYKKVLKRQRMI